MPPKLTVGLNKKIGLPDYGSLGASCSVEIEIDSQVMGRNSGLLQQQVQQAFDACSQAVECELARQMSPQAYAGARHAPGNNSPTNGTTNGHPQNGQHKNGHSKPNGRRATASQVRAILGIADRKSIDLAQELKSRFGVDRPEDLFVGDASRLIDDLKTGTQQSGG
jgi:hypothetical protein